MDIYYVIRNKNNGLFFRGKGANRWGKHLNQASIYRVKGTAEHTIERISWDGEQAEIVPIQIFDISEKQRIIDEAVKAIQAAYKEDSEIAHGKMDEVLLETLRKLGAGTIADAYENYPGYLYCT